MTSAENQESFFLAADALQALFDALIDREYLLWGPTERDGAIVFETMDQVDALPRGMEDRQSPGSYVLEKANHGRYFSFTNGAQALKPLVFAAEAVLWEAERGKDGVVCFREPARPVQKRAVIGVRACDLAALYIQDKHFLQADYVDPDYRARRQGLFLIAVNCTRAGSQCFCASTGDGPRARYGYDLALTELDSGFIVHAHSDAGREVQQSLPVRTPSAEELAQAETAIQSAAQQQRSLPSRNLRDALFSQLDNPRWDAVAERCLACGNCTAVCPTCFCNQELEQPLLDGSSSTHVRHWDSCFSPDHGYIHGLRLREETAGQYRQWLTHKLGSWHDQYGRSGCVGCGRCTTWCPVGIDLVEEVNGLLGEDGNA